MLKLAPLETDIFNLMFRRDWINGEKIDNYENKTMTGLRQMRKMVKKLGLAYEKRLKPGSRHHRQYRLI